MIEKTRAALLLVDDDELLLSAVARSLRSLRRPILTAADALRAGELLTDNEVGVVVCEPRDLRLSSFLVEVRERRPAAVRIVLTGYPDVTSVVKAVNEAAPFKLLLKPWLDDELLATVRLAFEQYAINVKRDRLIDEYAGIRANAERAHAFHVIDALMASLHPDMNPAALADLPVGALLVRDGLVVSVNSAALRFCAAVGLPAPAPDVAADEQAPPVAAFVAAALAAPHGRRLSHRLPGARLDCFARDIAAGTLIAFAPAPQSGHEQP